MRRLAGLLLLITTLGWAFLCLPHYPPPVLRGKCRVYLEERAMEYYYPGEVRVIVEQMVRSRLRPPSPAGLDKVTGEIVPHEDGIYFDVDKIVHDIVTAPAHTKLDLEGIPVVPLFRTEHLVQLTDVLGDFSTPVIGSPDRVHNIRLSLQAINNTIVMPGEVFSFNEVVGERTPEAGYRNAPIILGRLWFPVWVAGCQTSTTLYNAVRLAGLEIVERRIHSIAPSYIKHGMDAAVAWPTLTLNSATIPCL